MRALSEYLSEVELDNSPNPLCGDDFAIELDDVLIESYIVDVDDHSIVIEGDAKVFSLLENYIKTESIRRYGAATSNAGHGYALGEYDFKQAKTPRMTDIPPRPPRLDIDPEAIGNVREFPDGRRETRTADGWQQTSGPVAHKPRAFEDTDLMQRILELAGMPNADQNDPLAAKSADLAPVGVDQNTATATTVDEGVMSDIDMDMRHIAKTGRMDALVDAMRGEFGIKTAQYLQDMMDEVEHSLERRGMNQADMRTKLGMLLSRIQDTYAGQELDEAEYQGRKVALGKPMQGDVKKFKVYVRDPKTGNVKKVNFGDKTMRIKKSNPKRRKSFRARHNCANPGPRTKARYWSCRKW